MLHFKVMSVLWVLNVSLFTTHGNTGWNLLRGEWIVGATWLVEHAVGSWHSHCPAPSVQLCSSEVFPWVSFEYFHQVAVHVQGCFLDRTWQTSQQPSSRDCWGPLIIDCLYCSPVPNLSSELPFPQDWRSSLYVERPETKHFYDETRNCCLVSFSRPGPWPQSSLDFLD